MSNKINLVEGDIIIPVRYYVYMNSRILRKGFKYKVGFIEKTCFTLSYDNRESLIFTYDYLDKDSEMYLFEVERIVRKEKIESLLLESVSECVEVDTD